MNQLTMLIKDDMKPALGVTEPGAIAFATAKARDNAKGKIKSLKVSLNSGMYKNAFTCGIPNSDGKGNQFAAALGVIAGDASLGLEALAYITDEDNQRAKLLIEEGKVEVILDHMGSEITIDVRLETENDVVVVRIARGHTEIYEITKNNKVIFEKELQDKQLKAQVDIHKFSFHDIIEYVRTVDGNELEFIEEAFSMNMELLYSGLESSKTTFGPQLLKQNHNQIISKDGLATAQLLCNGALEARVLGLNKPAMSVTGSGAHGIVATMPLLAYYEGHKEDIVREDLLRATALSCLITIYIKEYSGKLSAFCGCGIAAGTGMACGLGFLKGGGEETLTRIIQNMATSITGMICDGGNQGCAMKGIVAVDAAFRSTELARKGVYVDAQHGINGISAEETMKNMGMIASPGMVKTEEVIVEIMQKKRNT